MRSLTLAISGLIALTTIMPPASADEPALAKAANSAYAHAAKDPVNQGPAILLRSVTRSVPRLKSTPGPIWFEHIALTAPNGAGATRGAASERGLKREKTVIDVLVAYTTRAASMYSDIRRELVDPSIAEANDSFGSSGIGHVKLRVVHAYQTDYAEEGGHFDHVWRLADKGDGYMEEVHDLRDAYRADIALLIVDDAKGCGLATRVSADADEAFAVVHHECAATSYTVAHEIGHLIGARHELGYVNGAKWRDIMSYKDSCGGCPRLPVWSSPRVLVNGEPAGTVVLDNARVIGDHAARVAAFR